MRVCSWLAVLVVATASATPKEPPFSAPRGPMPPHSVAAHVSAKQYGLQLTHSEVARNARERHRQGLTLKLALTNTGTRDLTEVRLYLTRAGSRFVSERQPPAVIKALPAGSQAEVTWTFETDGLREPKLSGARFLIEAVDPSLRRIVSFNQPSREAR